MKVRTLENHITNEMNVNSFVIVVSLIIFCSCKFTKPLLTIPQSNQVEIDSLTSRLIKTRHFHYIYTRDGIGIGKGKVQRTYSENGIISRKFILKTKMYPEYCITDYSIAL